MRSLHQSEGIADSQQSRSFELALARRHRCSKASGPRYHRDSFTIVCRLPCGTAANAQTLDTGSGGFRTVSNVATLSAQKAVEGLLASSSDINASVVDDTVVQQNCSLHIRGNLLGNLTIESGAKVVVEGSVDGKIVNKGGRL